MKGTFDLPITMFSVILTVAGITIVFVSLIASVTNVAGGLVKPSFERLAIIDTTHNVEACIFENGPVTIENIQQKISECKEKTEAGYIEISDASTGQKIASAGIKISQAKSHLIYKNIKSGEDVSQVKLYVEKQIRVI